MGITYSEALSMHFGFSEFTTKDVKILFGSDRSAKLLSDLKFKGVAERTGRGRYRILTSEERLKNRSFEWKRVEHIINNSPYPFAWTWISAVEKWTNGRYNVGPNPYLRVYYIEIRKSDLDHWHEYLGKNSISIDGKKRVGSTVKLFATNDLRITKLEGENVITMEKVTKMIRNNRELFGEADDLIES